MDTEIDKVSIEIGSNSDKAVNGLDKLQDSLEKLLNVTNAMTNSLSSLNSALAEIKNIGGIKIDTKGLEKARKEAEKAKISPKTEETGYSRPKTQSDFSDFENFERYIVNGETSLTNLESKFEEFGSSNALIPINQQLIEAKQNTENFGDAFGVVEGEVVEVTYPFENLKNKLKEIASLLLTGISNGANMAVRGLKGMLNAADKFGKDTIKTFSKVKSALSKVKGLMSKVFGGVEVDRGLKKILRYAMALFSIRGAYALISNASKAWLSSENAAAQQLSANIDYLKYTLGSALAPVIQYIVNLLTLMLRLIQQVAYAFTGVNIFANATASSMKGAAGSAKEMKKQLQGFDELNNIDFDSGSSGGGGGAVAPDIDFSKLEDMQSTLLDKIKLGDWYEVGLEIGNKINEALDKIPWDKIKATAGKIGKNLADLLNGILDGTSFKKLGNTIAQGYNTALNFAYNFVDTFHFDTFGTKVGEFINSSFANIQWDKTGQTISKGIVGILDFLLNAIEEINWYQVGRDFADMFKNIDWNTIVEKFFKLLGSAFGALSQFIWGIIEDVVMTIADFFSQQFEEAGGDIWVGFWNGIAKGIANIGQWIYERMVKPFVDGFCELLGIHSPSKVFEEFGGYVIEGFINGLKGIWENSKIIFTNLVENIKLKIDEIKTNFKTKFEEIKSTVKTKVGEIKDGFVNKIDEMKTGVKNKINDIKKGFEDFGRNVLDIPNKIKNAFSNMNIKMKMPHFSWTSTPAKGWMADILGALNLPTSLPKLNVEWYAQGGMPDTGELFVAREAGPELVGNIGSKSAVANNDQIIKGISQGVYEAVSNAMAEQQDDKRQIIVNVGNERLYSGYGKYVNTANNKYGTNVVSV